MVSTKSELRDILGVLRGELRPARDVMTKKNIQHPTTLKQVKQ
jgi:hypothetical protein